MINELSDCQLDNLAKELDDLYRLTQAKMGCADIAYLNNVKNYSLAIKNRSEALLRNPDTEYAFRKAITLRALHILLEFSLGHTVLHGAYDHLDGVGEFHSSKYRWDFATNVQDWKTMHHQNHHPFTNIKGKDHDIGYGVFRLDKEQTWWGHHWVQSILLGLVFLSGSAYFSMYTSYSAGAIDGKKWYNPLVYKPALKEIIQELYRSFVKQPMQAGKRFIPAFFANLFGNILGYDYTMLLLVLEHHADNVSMYEDKERNETRGEYLYRQIMATTNFSPNEDIDNYFKTILQEVDYPNPPNFRVFYAALDTHLEHHLFPDLPDNRLREVQTDTQRILKRYNLPYNSVELGDAIPNILKRIATNSAPNTSDKYQPKSRRVLSKAWQICQQIFYGSLYKLPPKPFYLATERCDQTVTKILSIKEETHDRARSFRFALPDHWQHMRWPAGAFLSLQVDIQGAKHIRQYSLTHASDTQKDLCITVKRVKGGLVSNYLHDDVHAGDSITLFRKPLVEPNFALQANCSSYLFVAGGVGITPIISMIRWLSFARPHAKMQLLYFNTDLDAVIFKDEIDKLENNSRLNVSYYFSRVDGGDENIKTGRISKEVLQAEVSDLHKNEVYACAPTGFMEALERSLHSFDFNMKQLHTEAFKPVQIEYDEEKEHKSYLIRFVKSKKEIVINGNTSLLKAARSVGIDIMSGCEKGLCKACLCHKVKGKTQHDQTGELEKITLCNALAESDLELNL